MNRKFIREVANQIEREPQHYNQQRFMDFSNKGKKAKERVYKASVAWEKRHICGTAGCIAGTVYALTDTKRLNDPGDFIAGAADLMGLTYKFVNENNLFCFTGREWPEPYSTRWDDAMGGRNKQAKVAVQFLRAIAAGRVR